jgi:hypothetical protein
MSDLSRRHFLQTASLAVAGVSLPGTLAIGALEPLKFAETPTFNPRALFLTWQHDPTTTMTVQWVGDEKDGATRPVWYSKKGSQMWRKQEHTARTFPKSDAKIFRAELSNLEPDTDYVFRIGTDSAEQRFRTMPAKDTNALQFVSGGDCGLGRHPRATNRLAGVQAPQFVVLGGDLAYENGRDGDAFLQFLENYSKDVRDDQQRLIPMLACLGNHEVDGSYGQPREKAPFFFSMFDGLFRDTTYGVVDFGQYMSLVLLDTNHISPIGGAQADWLDRTLKERQDCPNVFVFNHVPAYPSHRDFTGEDGHFGTGEENRIHWAPLFEKYRVDAVFEHHDHTFKRTHPMLDGRPNEKGVLYLGDGSWGKIRRPTKLEERPYLVVAHESYHLSVHRIEGNQRFHVALADSGRVVDICSTTKTAGTRRG